MGPLLPARRLSLNEVQEGVLNIAFPARRRGEEITKQFGRTVQRQVINRAAGSPVRGILGGLFRGT